MRQLILLCALLFAGGAAFAAQGPHPPIPLNLLDVAGPDDYPGADLGAKNQGVVEIKVTVDSDGKETDCRIVQSSGSRSLDNQTCIGIHRNVRFQPAVDQTGQTLFGIYSGQFMWTLPDMPRPKKPPLRDLELMVKQLPGGADLEIVPVVVVTAADGHMETCAADDEAAAKALVAAACHYAEQEHAAKPATDRAGKPIRSVQMIRVMFFPERLDAPAANAPRRP